ncbi:MAG: zinc-ribbon domain-containing protein [Clostridiales bacterium]|nr:zinc-ribbon domain-containing protein [Clostridiales bacterium]
MKKCNNCGHENSDDALFCGKCGQGLTEDKPELCSVCGAPIVKGMRFCVKCGHDKNAPSPLKEYCAVCGAEIKEGGKFCSKCGHSTTPPPQKIFCAICGAEIEGGEDFCSKCGTKVGTEPYRGEPITDFSAYERCPDCGAVLEKDSAFCLSCGRNLSSGKGVSSAKKSGAAKANVRAKFDKHSHYIVNAFIIALAVAMILISLLCPVKIAMPAPDLNDLISSSSYEDVDCEMMEISQSPWQILGALKYVSFDMKDKDAQKTIDDFEKEMNAAATATEKEFKKWYEIHENTATVQQALDKLYEITAKYMSDINLLGWEFVYTAVGAADYYTDIKNFEKNHTDELIVERDEAIVTLIASLVAVGLQLGIAAVSLVFLILAIVGMIKRKKFGVIAMSAVIMLMAGIGLIALSVAPVLAPSGALLVLAIIAAVSFFVFGLTRAILDGKSPVFIAKRVITAAFVLPAFFMLCTHFIKITEITETKSSTSAVRLKSPLGYVFGTIISTLEIGKIGSSNVIYSSASTVNGIVTFALGILSVIFLLVTAFIALRKLAYKTEKNDRFDTFALISSILLIALAIAPAIIGAVDKEALISGSDAGIQYKFAAGALVYVSMAFAIAAFVFELIFNAGRFANRPKPVTAPASPAAPATESAPQAETSTTVETVTTTETVTVTETAATVQPSEEKAPAAPVDELAEPTVTPTDAQVEPNVPEQPEAVVIEPQAEVEAANEEPKLTTPKAPATKTGTAKKPAPKSTGNKKPTAKSTAGKKPSTGTAAKKSTSGTTAKKSTAKKPADNQKTE